MKFKYFFCVAGFILISGILYAGSGHKYLDVLEAYSQRTLPGVRGAAITTNYHFVAIWKKEKRPDAFAWCGDHTWQQCNVTRAHKITTRNPGIPRGIDYQEEIIRMDAIRKGDTLDLLVAGGSSAGMPGGIPGDARNTLYFKTGNKWMGLPVTSITKKPDIAMP